MKQFLLVSSLMLLFASCTQTQDDSLTDKVFHASTEQQISPDTKVYTDNTLKVRWNEGDLISIFNRDNYNRKYKFQGTDGATSGEFKKAKTEFYTADELEDNLQYAIYPFISSSAINSSSSVMTVFLPSEQIYKTNSFGIGANTMVAVTEDEFLSFKNAGGYLSIRLYGNNVSVNSITLRGNNHEKIAGNAEISIPLGGLPTVTMTDGATDAISIVCNPAIRIGERATEYTSFWFVIPPVKFASGFTITVIDDNGRSFEKSTSNSITVVRNQLDWMEALEVNPS